MEVFIAILVVAAVAGAIAWATGADKAIKEEFYKDRAKAMGFHRRARIRARKWLDDL